MGTWLSSRKGPATGTMCLATSRPSTWMPRGLCSATSGVSRTLWRFKWRRSRLARAYGDLLREVRTDTPLTCDLLRHIHARIFGDLYNWAGRCAGLWISKPNVTWPAPDFLDANMHCVALWGILSIPAPRAFGSDKRRKSAGDFERRFADREQ